VNRATRLVRIKGTTVRLCQIICQVKDIEQSGNCAISGHARSIQPAKVNKGVQQYNAWKNL
jgi:hypothetical protein